MADKGNMDLNVKKGWTNTLFDRLQTRTDEHRCSGILRSLVAGSLARSMRELHSKSRVDRTNLLALITL